MEAFKTIVALAALVALASGNTVPSGARQTSTAGAATADNDSATSPWSLSYWMQRQSLTEAMSVMFPRINGPRMTCETPSGSDFKEGVCVRWADCAYYNGVRHGYCGGGLGVCCVFAKKCAQSTNEEVSQFVSTNFETPDFGTGECKLTINPINSDICQYRLDFESFSIEGPAENSECNRDFMTVSGGSAFPKLCGDLTGQHFYINQKPGSGSITITIDTQMTHKAHRNWNIKITQIGCKSTQKAPAGCLQFYNSTSGNVKSFNFGPITKEEGSTAISTRQIQNLEYGICIHPKVGYCDLTWTMSESSGPKAFSVSGDASGEDTTFKSDFGVETCAGDNVIIPGAKFEDELSGLVKSDVFCGTKFPEVTTSFKPYVMYVKNDADEDFDKENAGFSLNFRQNLC